MQFTTFGKNCRAGSYLLMIELRAEVELSFGRFMGGKPIHLDRGNYLYVGSALGSRPGTFPLASRLLRHASRSGDKPPHALRASLSELFRSNGFETKQRRIEKRLHWHIDYLLDLPEAELSHVVMVREPARLEERLAKLVGSMPGIAPVADRLGAQDATSGTHLFNVDDPAELLERLNATLPILLSS